MEDQSWVFILRFAFSIFYFDLGSSRTTSPRSENSAHGVTFSVSFLPSRTTVASNDSPTRRVAMIAM